jgi:enamine deaminase RidA (YjgF/YER057c/UK114 family)
LAARLSPELRDALGHPLRRQILRLLQGADAPCDAAGLATRLRCGVSLASYHARVLEACRSVAPDGPAYSTAVVADQQVLAILRATRRIDDRLCI